jgi:hypothetical protein
MQIARTGTEVMNSDIVITQAPVFQGTILLPILTSFHKKNSHSIKSSYTYI